MFKNNLDKIKDLIREWYGVISINEIMSNHQLVEIIEKIEHSLKDIEHSKHTWRENCGKAYQ